MGGLLEICHGFLDGSFSFIKLFRTPWTWALSFQIVVTYWS